jgi:hypothetical protein
MRAIIEFDLDNPDDVDRHKLFMKAEDMANALWGIQMNLRRTYEKHRTPKHGETYEDAIDKIFMDIADILEENDIDPYKLIH